MNQNIIIKELQAKDAQTVIAYLNTVGKESHNLSFGKEGISIPLKEEIKIIESYHTHPINTFWGAWDGEELVGVCSIDVPSRKRMAHRAGFGLSVRKDHWHCGIGHMLMNTMMAHVRSIPSITMITLEVIADNERAISLYEQYGFRTCGCWHKFFFIDGMYYDALLMEYDLSTKEETTCF